MTKNAKISLKLIEVVCKIQKKLKIQFAFYRNQKQVKLKPTTFDKPNQKLLIDQPPLQILSTLQQKKSTNRTPQISFQQKIFNLQILYKVDSFDKQEKIFHLNVSQYYNDGQKTHQIVISQQNPKIKLKYQMSIEIQDKKHRQVKQERQLQKAKSHKVIKIIKFENQDQTKPQIQNKNQISFSRDKFKSSNTQRRIQQVFQQAVQSPLSKKQQKQDNSKLVKQLQLLNKKLNGQLLESTSAKKQVQAKLMQIGQKYKKLKINFKQLQTNQEQNASNKDILSHNQQNLQQKQKQINRITQQSTSKINQLQSRVQKYEGQKQSNSSLIKKLKDQIKNSQRVNIELLQKLKTSQSICMSLQNSKQNNSHDIQSSIKPYKQKIKSLQLHVKSLQQQKNQLQKQATIQLGQVGELRTKIKLLNQQNLSLIQKSHEKDYQNQKLLKKIQELNLQIKLLQKQKQQKSPFSIKSQKIIGGQTISQMKAELNELKIKLSISQKNLQNKEQLLKRFNQFSKQGEKEKEQSLEKIKMENKRLIQKLQNIQTKEMMNETGGLQAKVILQKVKKELEIKSKNERALLIQKSQLESRSKILQQQIVKSKQSVANMLNVVQQFGDEDLIADVMSYL